MHIYMCVFIYGFPYLYMMADYPRVHIHIYSPTAYRDMILQKHTLFNLQDDVSNSSSSTA